MNISYISIKNPYGFIYITTNLINGKKYIGQKKFDNASRWKSYLGSGFHLINAVKYYGKENFIREIIDIAYSAEDLNRKEEEYIKYLNAVDSESYYNMIEGGNVQESLSRRNSISVLCINNEMIFNSIADASAWSGYTSVRIKDTFDEKNTIYTYENDEYIFRPLNDSTKNLRHCRLCGNVQNNRRQHCKMCEECHEIYIINKKLKKCKGCGVRFKSKSNSHVRCETCSKNRTTENNRIRARKYRNKLI